MAGANMPFILRKAPSADYQNSYSVVGVCYVHGIMDGKAVNGPDAGAVEEIILV